MQNTLTVAGYACFFNDVDQSNDIISPTAFSLPGISQRPSFSDVKFLYQHDVTRPIGRWTLIQPDKIGLYVEGILDQDLVDGAQASILTKNQIINGLSIGYQPVHTYQNDDGNRVIEHLKLFEISLVTFPMQKNAYLYHTPLNTPTP